ncbi:MAG: hypothetical protein NW214_17000 [Pseudanabaenaceae cyanobacterium bins.39]|nr:hypothetical protein [Pseudanabaenaceae cyanobacterium bins.39]
MKKFLNCYQAILSVCFSSVAYLAWVNNAYALEEGFYWGGGSRYIQIAKKTHSVNGVDSDRFCYQGFSSYGTSISSLELLTPNSRNDEFTIYILHGNAQEQNDRLALVQSKYRSGLIAVGKFGDILNRSGRPLQYQLDVNASSASFRLSPELQDCLNSDQPYHKQILSNRDRR